MNDAADIAVSTGTIRRTVVAGRRGDSATDFVECMPAMRKLPVVLLCRRGCVCAVGQIIGFCLPYPALATEALCDRHETWCGMRWMRR